MPAIVCWFCISAAAAQVDAMNNESPLEGVTFQTITANGISMRLAVAGDSGPLVLLAHGWPESWYSWRHQLLALAEAGYRAVAPDMRGYGQTDAPGAVEDYDMEHLTADLVGLLEDLPPADDDEDGDEEEDDEDGGGAAAGAV